MRYKISPDISYIVLLDDGFIKGERVLFWDELLIYLDILEVGSGVHNIFRKVKFSYDGEVKVGWINVDFISLDCDGDDLFDGRFNAE